MSLHRVTVTSRRFRLFSRPTVTTTFEKDCRCIEAEAMGEAARKYGAVVVTVDHLDHDGGRIVPDSWRPVGE